MQPVFEVAAVTCVGCANVHRIMGSPAEIPLNYNCFLQPGSLFDDNSQGENGESLSPTVLVRFFLGREIFLESQRYVQLEWVI